jgi:hypothetical protein
MSASPASSAASPPAAPLPPPWVQSKQQLLSAPAAARLEVSSATAALHAAVLSNFQSHVGALRGSADAARALSALSPSLSRLSDDAGGAAAALSAAADALPADAAALARARRSLGAQATLLEVLEAPALAGTCVRAGLWDEALDLAEYASSLYFAHRLWLPACAGAAGGAAVIRTVVDEIRRAAADLRDALLRALAAPAALPQVLALLGHLRRLYAQRALARRRTRAAVAAHAAAAAQPAAAGGGAQRAAAAVAAAAAAAVDVSLPPEDEAAIVERLIAEFLACRDAWHRGELDLISKHNAYAYVRAAAAAGVGKGRRRGRQLWPPPPHRSPRQPQPLAPCPPPSRSCCARLRRSAATGPTLPRSLRPWRRR